MIYTALRDMIKARLGFRRDLDTNIRLEIDLAQMELENRPELPWFLKKDWVVQNDENQNFITKDFSFLMLQDRSKAVRVVDEEGVEVPLKRMSYPELRIKLSRSTETGLTKNFAEHEDRIYIGPEPDVRYTYHIACWRREVQRSAMVDDESLQTNLWYKYSPELIIWATVYNLASQLQMAEKTKEAYSMREGKYRELMTRSTAMEEAARLRELNPQTFTGEEDDS